MNERLYCEVEGCERPVGGHGKDLCSTHMKQVQRTGKTQPIAEKLSLEERVIMAGNAMVQAEDDNEGYEEKRRAFLLASKGLGQKASRDAMKLALDSARARGIRLGRPPKVDLKALRELMKLKTPQLVARLLGVSERTLYRARRALSRRTDKNQDSGSSSPRGDARPRSG